MLPGGCHSTYRFRVPSEKDPSEKLAEIAEDATNEKEPCKEEHILCRQCLHIITSPAERIEVQGSHQHTFANPQGILFQIGCFRSAPGCGSIGPATYEWSWFRGFRWRVALCSMCLTHLGWHYTSSGNESFYGLILSRLISPNEWS